MGIIQIYSTFIIFRRSWCWQNNTSKDITELVFDVKDTQHIEYLKALKSLGVKLYLISHLNESDFNKLKLNYIDVGPIMHLPHNNKETFLKENTPELIPS